MSSMVRVEAPRVSRTELGKVVEEVWTTVAADCDGEVLYDEIGKRTRTRTVMLAWRSEVEEWLAQQVATGWSAVHGPTPCATLYFGDTDSPSNCWSARVERPEP